MEHAAVDLQFVGHATVLIEVAGIRILTDPFFRSGLGPLERHGPLPEPDAFGDIDLILVSHGHPDHLDPLSLAMVPGRPTIIVPGGLGPAVRRSVGGNVVEVVAGERGSVGGLAIEAVPARHWITPGAPRARPQGYLVDGATRIWFAGDTGRFPGIADLAGRVDLALLPIWTWGPHLGPGHLGPRSAAEVLAQIGAQAAVPMHWGTLYPRRLDRLWRGPLQGPGERFAAHAATIAPHATIRVLRPGESATI